MSDWHVYVLKCADGTLYTGVATDTARRLLEHNHSPKGARYTRTRRPVTLAAAWSYEGRSAACKIEYAFKQLSRQEKLRRIRDDDPLRVEDEPGQDDATS